MSGALYLLTVNFLIALLFCAFFLVISPRSRLPAAGRWFAAAFAIASISAIFEMAIRFADFDRFSSFGAFSTLLASLFMIRIGIGYLYAMPANVSVIGWLYGASLIINLLIYDLPRNGWHHALGYQLPFFVAEIVSALAVFTSGRRELRDRVLMALLTATGFYFLSKIYFATRFAGTDAQSYLSSVFALVSQSTGAVLVVSTGLTLLAIIVVDIMDTDKAHSELDPLSGLLNRRGFQARIDRILSRPVSAFPHCVILADLDHFKAVNDTYGHTAGDRVITGLANLLMEKAPPGAICARLGGEEFAVFLPATSSATGYVFAQGLRGDFSERMHAGLPDTLRLTASFGVCAMKDRGDTIEEIIDLADAALYEAKRSGRNRVNLVSPARDR